MKPKRPLRTILLMPLIYLAAAILLLEEWLWDLGARIMRVVAAWPLVRALEERIRTLPPYGALCVFVLPGLLLFPVKILALMAIAKGHAFSGVAAMIVAKVAGAAAVARLYALTKPTLLSLAWFARWHDWFMALKERWIGRLKATRAYQHVGLLTTRLRSALKALVARLRPRQQIGGRHSFRPTRVMRRVLAMWKARRR